MTGENRSGFGQGEQLRLDGVDNSVEVAVGTPSRSGAALEEGIARKEYAFAVFPAEFRGVEADRAGECPGWRAPAAR